MVHFDPLVKKMSDVNHPSGPLRKRKFSSTGQKVIVYDLWLVDFDPFFEFLCFKVRCLWSYCDQNPTLNIFDRFHPWTSDFQISMRQKYWRFRLTFEIVKVLLSAVCKQSFLSHMPLTLYKTFAWQTFASLRLFTCLVYVSTYCVPIAHLRQNKPFPLLYLGHAQIIMQNTAECWKTYRIQRWMGTSTYVVCITREHSLGLNSTNVFVSNL